MIVIITVSCALREFYLIKTSSEISGSYFIKLRE